MRGAAAVAPRRGRATGGGSEEVRQGRRLRVGGAAGAASRRRGRGAVAASRRCGGGGGSEWEERPLPSRRLAPQLHLVLSANRSPSSPSVHRPLSVEQIWSCTDRMVKILGTKTSSNMFKTKMKVSNYPEKGPVLDEALLVRKQTEFRRLAHFEHLCPPTCADTQADGVLEACSFRAPVHAGDQVQEQEQRTTKVIKRKNRNREPLR
uniref:Uncharacterized protein n=1 Tax=Oryza meridionalis TaxID=40149 RepID=A0A0E0CKH9_9ORYZ